MPDSGSVTDLQERTEVLSRPAPPTIPVPSGSADLTVALGTRGTALNSNDTVPLAARGNPVVAAPTWSVRLQADVPDSPAVVRHLREGEVLVVGRADPNRSGAAGAPGQAPSTLFVPDIHISRSHLELRAEAGQLTVTDLGSTTGTFLSGQRLHPAQAIPVGRGTVIDLAWQPGTQRAAARLHIS